MKKTLLSLTALIAGFSLLAQNPCSNIFISEYVEGSGNSKAIEIYNPTASPINLNTYQLKRYSNGSTTNPDVFQLSGIIGPYDVIVIANGQTDSVSLGGGAWSPPCDPALQAIADLLDNDYPAPCYFNGDDALTIENSSGAIVDIFGKVGEDPGVAWTDDPTANPPYSDSNGGTWWTANQTLIRKASVRKGVTANPAAFIVTAEYDSLPQNTWTNLGTHGCECDPSYISVNELSKGKVSIYPNPAAGGSFTVTGTTDMKEISVFNVLGQSVWNKNYNQGVLSANISTQSMAQGMYLVNVLLYNGHTLIQKVIFR
jgi:hypothetical protein